MLTVNLTTRYQSLHGESHIFKVLYFVESRHSYDSSEEAIGWANVIANNHKNGLFPLDPAFDDVPIAILR